MFSYILIFAILIAVPLGIAVPIRTLFKTREAGIPGLFVVGSFVMLGCAFVAHLVAAFLHLDLDKTCIVFGAALLVVVATITAVGVIVSRRRAKRETGEAARKEQISAAERNAEIAREEMRADAGGDAETAQEEMRADAGGDAETTQEKSISAAGGKVTAPEGLINGDRGEDQADVKTKKKGLGAVASILAICVLLILCFLNMHIYEPNYGEDMTLDKTLTILDADGVYRQYPATGMELTLGVSKLGKLDFVPTFYAMMCRIGRLGSVAWGESLGSASVSSAPDDGVSGGGLSGNSAYDDGLSGSSAYDDGLPVSSAYDDGLSGSSAYGFLCGVLPFWIVLLNISTMYLFFSRLFKMLGSKIYAFYAILIYMAMLLTWDISDNPAIYSLVHRGWQESNLLWMVGIPILAYAFLLVLDKFILSKSVQQKSKLGKSMLDESVLDKSMLDESTPDKAISGKCKMRILPDPARYLTPVKRGLIVAGICFAVSVAGTAFPCMPRTDLVRNYKTQYEPQTEIMKLVLGLGNRMSLDGEEMYLCAPSEIMYSVRYFNPYIKTVYGKNIEGTANLPGFEKEPSGQLSEYHETYSGEQTILYQFMEMGGDPTSCLRLAMPTGCNVIVLRGEADEGVVESFGLNLYVADVEGYAVYLR